MRRNRRPHPARPLGLWAGLLLIPLGRLACAGAGTEVLVVFASGVPAYAEALEGVKNRLAAEPFELRLVDVTSAPDEAAAALARPSLRMVLAIGTDAQRAVAPRSPEIPVVSTMVLRADSIGPVGRRSAGVYLDVPAAGLLAELKDLFPGKARLGLIRNPSQQDASFALRAGQAGFIPVVADCSQPQDLLPAFLSLRGHADFVVTLPDSVLYNSATIKPLILASLEHRLPVVGFSSAFVRAGAAAGVYPSFGDIGAQAADLAVRYLSGRGALADEAPRKLVAAVNLRIARLLGIPTDAARSGNLVILR